MWNFQGIHGTHGNVKKITREIRGNSTRIVAEIFENTKILRTNCIKISGVNST